MFEVKIISIFTIKEVGVLFFRFVSEWIKATIRVKKQRGRCFKGSSSLVMSPGSVHMNASFSLLVVESKSKTTVCGPKINSNHGYVWWTCSEQQTFRRWRAKMSLRKANISLFTTTLENTNGMHDPNWYVALFRLKGRLRVKQLDLASMQRK